MAENQETAVASADASATAARATAEPSNNSNGESSTAKATTDKSGGESKLDADDTEEASAPGTADVNAPEGQGSAESDAPATAGDSTSTANKNKRKSSGGVPEHKTKKLNKKKSMVTLNLELEPGNYVWARLKGHPSWPAIVCDESMLPEVLLGNRPVSTKRPDGSYREDFMDGAKNAKDRTFPVMFLSTNEFAWMVNSSLGPLDVSELTVPEGKKLIPALRDAYDIAAVGHPLDHFKEVLDQHEEERKKYEQEAQEQAERKAAEKAEKAEKAERKAEKDRRKSKAGDEGASADGEKASKKRKKDAESEGEGTKPKKTPKVKLNNKDKDKEAKPETAKKSKPKKKVAKPGEDAAPELSEPERLARREKAIFYLRHRLQKCFLSNTTPPDDEMPAMAEFFTQLEQHKDLETQIIRKTKIHKVLKNIVRLETVPREEEFNFKSRSSEMLNHWNSALAAGDGDTSMADAGPATNGAQKAEEAANGIEEKTNGADEKDDPAKASTNGKAADEGGDSEMVDATTTEPKLEESDGAKDDAEKAETETAKESAEDAAEDA